MFLKFESVFTSWLLMEGRSTRSLQAFRNTCYRMSRLAFSHGNQWFRGVADESCWLLGWSRYREATLANKTTASDIYRQIRKSPQLGLGWRCFSTASKWNSGQFLFCLDNGLISQNHYFTRRSLVVIYKIKLIHFLTIIDKELSRKHKGNWPVYELTCTGYRRGRHWPNFRSASSENWPIILFVCPSQFITFIIYIVFSLCCRIDLTVIVDGLTLYAQIYCCDVKMVHKYKL